MPRLVALVRSVRLQADLASDRRRACEKITAVSAFSGGPSGPAEAGHSVRLLNEGGSPQFTEVFRSREAVVRKEQNTLGTQPPRRLDVEDDLRRRQAIGADARPHRVPAGQFLRGSDLGRERRAI